jgi:hypothetical protein
MMFLFLLFLFFFFVLFACSFWLYDILYPGQAASKKDEMKRRL